MYGFHATPLDFLQTVKNAIPEADWKPFMIPMEDAGEKAAPGIEMATTSWYVVSKNCEHPEALIQLMNLYCEKVLDPERTNIRYMQIPETEWKGYGNWHRLVLQVHRTKTRLQQKRLQNR